MPWIIRGHLQRNPESFCIYIFWLLWLGSTSPLCAPNQKNVEMNRIAGAPLDFPNFWYFMMSIVVVVRKTGNLTISMEPFFLFLPFYYKIQYSNLKIETKKTLIIKYLLDNQNIRTIPTKYSYSIPPLILQLLLLLGWKLYLHSILGIACTTIIECHSRLKVKSWDFACIVRGTKVQLWSMESLIGYLPKKSQV